LKGWFYLLSIFNQSPSICQLPQKEPKKQKCPRVFPPEDLTPIESGSQAKRQRERQQEKQKEKRKGSESAATTQRSIERCPPFQFETPLKLH